MNRRRYLAAVGAAGSGLAGCLTDARRGRTAETTTATRSPRERVRIDDVTLPVERSELLAALSRDQIPAITTPAFAADWDGLTLPSDSDGDTTRLPADAPVVGVEHDGEARAYPLRVLDWHEVVNDDFGGPLLVTYCVQCGSAVVAERTVGGTETTFGVSGYLWRSDLVLYDTETESLWSQLLAMAINGPATGERLRIQPSSLTTWGAWRADHPETRVLLPPPASNTVRGRDRTKDYFVPKYSDDGRALIGRVGDGATIHPQELVVGVEHDGEARAYPARMVTEAGGVVNDIVGGRPVVVAAAAGGTLVAYDRRVDGETHSFEPAGETFLDAGGSRWRRTTGVAVSGPHERTRLTRANELPPLFWLGWSEFNPETTVYGLTERREED